MTGAQTVFVAVGALGFLFLLAGLLLGELGEHHLDVDHDVDVDHDLHLDHDAGAVAGGGLEAPDRRTAPVGGPLHQPSPWSLRVLAVSAVGFGAAGYAATASGLPEALAWPVAAGSFLAVGYTTHRWILKPLARQQYNSLLSRYSYIGRDAVVSVEILAGGSGQVTFRDRQGARVTQTAWSDGPDPVGTGTEVEIVDVVDGGVIVHGNHLAR